MNFYERLVAVDIAGSESVEQPIKKVGDSIRGYMQEPKGCRVEDSLSGPRLSDAQLHKLACTMFTLPRSENRRILRKVNDSVRRKLIDQGKRIRRAVADGILDYDPELSWALRHIIDFDDEDGLDILLDRDKAGKLPSEVKTWFDAYMQNRHSNATYDAQQKLGNFRYTVLNQRRPVHIEDAKGDVSEFMEPAAEEEVAIDEAVEEGVKSVEFMSDKAEDVVRETQDKIEQEFTSFAERISRMVEETAEDIVAAQAVGATSEKVEEVVEETEKEAAPEGADKDGSEVSETDLDAFGPVEDAGLGTAALKSAGGVLGNVLGGLAKGVGSLGRSFIENFVEEMGGDFTKLKGSLKRLWNAAGSKPIKELIATLDVRYPDGVYLVKRDGDSYKIHGVLDKNGDVDGDLTKKYNGQTMDLKSMVKNLVKGVDPDRIRSYRYIVMVENGKGKVMLADDKWNPKAPASLTSTTSTASVGSAPAVSVASGMIKDKSLVGRRFDMHLDRAGRFIVDKVSYLQNGAADKESTHKLRGMEFAVASKKDVPDEYKDKLVMIVPVTGKYVIGYSPVSDSAPIEGVVDELTQQVIDDLMDVGVYAVKAGGDDAVLQYDADSSVLTYFLNDAPMGIWEVEDLASELLGILDVLHLDVDQLASVAAIEDAITDGVIESPVESLSRDGFLADVVAALKADGRYTVDAGDGSHVLVRNAGNGVDFIYHLVDGEVKDFWNAGADLDAAIDKAAGALLEAVWGDISGEDDAAAIIPAGDDVKPADVPADWVKPIEEVKDADETGKETAIDWEVVGDILYDWGKAHSFSLAQDASQEALIAAMHDLSDALADTRLEVRIDESVPQLLLKDQRYIIAQPDALMVGTTAFVYQMDSDGVEAFASGVSRSGVQLGQEIYSEVTDSLPISAEQSAAHIRGLYSNYVELVKEYNQTLDPHLLERLNIQEVWFGLPKTAPGQKAVIPDYFRENVEDSFNCHVLEDALEVIKNKGDWKRWPYAADLTFLQNYPKMRAVFDDVLTEEQKENVLKQVETEIKEALKEKGINIEDSVSVSVQTADGASATVEVKEDGSVSTTAVSESTGEVVSASVDAGVVEEVVSSDPAPVAEEPVMVAEEPVMVEGIQSVEEEEMVELPESSVGVAEVMDGALNTYDAPHDYTTYKKIRNTRTVLDSVLTLASKVADCSPMSIDDYCAACAAKKVPASHLKYMSAVADTVFQLNELDLICDSLYKRKLSDSFWVSDCGGPVAEAFGIELDEDAVGVPVVVSNAAFPIGAIPGDVPTTVYDLGDGKSLYVAVVDLDR